MRRTPSDAGFWKSLVELYGYASRPMRRHLHVLLALMIVGAFAELATIGSLLPLLSLLAGVDQPGRTPSIARLFAIVGATTPREQIWVAALLFAGMALFAAAIRLWLNWSTQTFRARLGQELSVNVQHRVLTQPYAYHLAHNSSEAVAAIDTVYSLVVDVVLQLIYAVAGAFMAIVIVAALMYIDPFTATIAAVAFSLVYLFVSAITRPRLARNSELIRATYEERIRIVQESVGGIRDVIIDGADGLYLDAFSEVSRRYAVASATTTFIAAAPRFIIEAAGMAVIALVAMLIANREGGLANALPLLGAIALGAQRLLPLLQQVYQGWASTSGHRSALFDVLQLLRLPIDAEPMPGETIEPLRLRDQISFEGVSFAYSGSRSIVLDEVTLQIPRGVILGVVGTTGSGKSTFSDLIMGLIEPTAGQIKVDGIPLTGEARLRWQRGIAHVPQAIFLADASIAQNIAFGMTPEEIDLERVRAAAATAQLDTFVTSLPKGYDTSIGERGIRLSGGQRQRLGIARAIYKRAPVLVLDEATSALDDTTEAAVMEALAKFGQEGRTVIVIAHRLSTLARCDLLARIEQGRVELTCGHAQLADLASAKH